MKTRRHFLAFFVGFLFATGLAVSQMTRPDRVIGFLDIFGDWDPTLLGVMGGGVLVYFGLFKRVTDRGTPMFSDIFRIPDRTDITSRLVLGSALFGVGWGLAGYCPGPALTALPSATGDILIFVAAMIGGMLLFRVYDHINLRQVTAGVSDEGASLPASKQTDG